MSEMNSVVCQRCGTMNDAGARFCQKCGEGLVEGTPSKQNKESRNWNITAILLFVAGLLIFACLLLVAWRVVLIPLLENAT